jgi:hypothetical protein
MLILLRIEALDMTDILDFGKIGKELVVQLSDDGIRTVLLCVDSVNTVKRLKLANCISITGIGLEPLRGSTMIEQIDLSLVGKHQSPEIDPEPPISCEAVLPILDSIISQGGFLLKHLQFPYKWQRQWRGHRAEEQQSQAFITRYNQMLKSRGAVSCVQCNENIPRQREDWMHLTYGRQDHTCYECLKHYCQECEDDGGDCVLPDCHECRRMYCQQCERMNYCWECNRYCCVDCVEVKECAGRFSPNCNSIVCEECIVGNHMGIDCFACGYLCGGCLENMDNPDYRRDCNCCGKSFCPDCEYERRERIEGLVPCTGCVQLAHPVLVEENKQLKSEVKDLKEQIEKMKIEA